MMKMADFSNLRKEEVVQKAYEIAFAYERDVLIGPQCVLSAMEDVFGIGSDDLLKSVTGLAGGGALCGEGTCGALAGGIMAIGLVCGRDKKGFKAGERGTRTYEVARKLYCRFHEEYGGITCRDVQEKIFGRSFDLWNEDDYRIFEKMGGHTHKCPDVVGKTAMWTADILFDELKKHADF
jgi:C_GCAxxG_C_C family probable redox protein